MLSDADIAHVRRGWAAAAVDPDRTAAAFYGHLFRIEPDARALFRNDMAVQGRKLAETLDTIVDALDSPEVLLPAARDLARRHVAYGVQAHHYDAVGAALLATLSDLLGGAFSVEERTAWERLYAAIAAEMTAATTSPGARCERATPGRVDTLR